MQLNLRTNHIILSGFALVLVIVAALTIIWLTHISTTNDQLTDIVDDHKKSELVFSMRDAASQRALSLYRMSILEDPFEQDDEYLKFRKQAENFIKARIALSEAGETKQEREAWHLAQPLVQRGTESQTEAAEKITDGDITAANELMVNKVIPNQNAVLSQLTGMLILQKEHVLAELDEAKKLNNRVYFQVTLLGSFALVIGVIITFFVIYSHNRGEKKLIRAQLESQEANQHKSLFLANMSHELRTPLNAIIGYSEMLQEEAKELNHESFFDDLGKINNSGQNLLNLINDILDVSKIESGKMEIYTEDFNLGRLIREISDTIQPLLVKTGNSLQIDLPDIDVGMHTDLTKLRQILYNLLSNANKFTLRGEIRISISAFVEHDIPRVMISVADSGVGMNSEQLEKVFSPFTQADASTTRNFGGTGLGLTISKRFCEMMGGNITVESQESVGTTFTISIPIRVTSSSNSENAA